MIDTKRRTILTAMLALPAFAHSQSSWPSGTVTMVVPAPPGGSLDVIARLMQTGLQQRLGVTVIVENRGGAATLMGGAVVAKAPRDGSKWLINADPQALNPSLRPNMQFDSKELEPVMKIGTTPNVLAAHPGSPYHTLADVLAAARKPEGVNFAVIADTIAYVAMLQLGKTAGARFVPVPYPGGAPAVNDALGGHVPLIAGSAGLLANHLTSGKLRPVVQTGLKRHPGLPDVPTIAESGFPGFSGVAFWGIYAPSGTPIPIVNRFVADATAALQEDAVRRRLEQSLMLELDIGGPAVFRPFYEEQVRMWGQVIRENGLKGS